jgi:glycosyltransferase involved in cell wall biosynthesis
VSQVSVIIPFYNRINPCAEALSSVVAQTNKEYELILVDDGSTDDTSTIAEAVKSHGGRFIRQEQKGVAAARNCGAAVASAEWLCFLDSDDRWLPQKLERQLAYHAENPKLRLSQTKERWFRNGVRVNPRERHSQPNGEAFLRSLELCCISPSSVMLSRQLFESEGGFDERMRVCEDYDLWLRITCREQVGLVEEDLVEKFGGHADQLSRSEPAMDRFRIYSLVKLLQSGRLNSSQQRDTIAALQTKSEVLQAGADKRGNVLLSEVLVEILNRSHIKDYEYIWFDFSGHERLLSSELISEDQARRAVSKE